MSKYLINTSILINNREWEVTEYRMGRGRKWIYILAHKRTDGSYDTMSLEENAIDQILNETK
jgi:hypothetical protein